MTSPIKTGPGNWQRWLPAVGAALTPGLLLCGFKPASADAGLDRIFTLPFWDQYRVSCGFGCYPGHEGTDYEIGTYGVGGERVAAAASGVAKSDCGLSPTAGYYLVMDHGNGYRTRYLHLKAAPLPASGTRVGRGTVIGYEGNTGDTNPPGFYHLHFETRVGAVTFTCGMAVCVCV